MLHRTAFLSLAFAMVLAINAAPAHADTLRCGNVLIRTGHSMGYVREKCGEPTSTEIIEEPIRARRPDGTTWEVGTARREIWIYRRSSRQFPAVLTFEEGVLKKLEFES